VISFKTQIIHQLRESYLNYQTASMLEERLSTVYEHQSQHWEVVWPWSSLVTLLNIPHTCKMEIALALTQRKDPWAGEMMEHMNCSQLHALHTELKKWPCSQHWKCSRTGFLGRGGDTSDHVELDQSQLMPSFMHQGSCIFVLEPRQWPAHLCSYGATCLVWKKIKKMKVGRL
jgi:hypothetical protein